jgi:hypothetical protein
LLLDGFGWVNLGVVPDFAFEDDTGSIEAWCRAGPITYNANLFAHRSGATRYSVNLDADKQGIGMWNGSVYQPTVSIPNVTTNWHHLVVVFEYGEFKVYLDGALAGSQYRPLGGRSHFPNPTGLHFTHCLDEVGLAPWMKWRFMRRPSRRSPDCAIPGVLCRFHPRRSSIRPG